MHNPESPPKTGATSPPAAPKGLAWLLNDRTYLMSIVSVLVIFFATISWFQIPMEVMPKENTPSFLSVSVDAIFPASPERMELMLTAPVEGALRTVPRVQGISSQTNGRGISVSLTLQPRSNLDLAVLQVQEALQELESQSILDMRKVSVSKLNPDANAVVRLSVNSATKNKNFNQLIREDLRIAIESLPQVSKVEVVGLDPLVYEYQLDVKQMEEFGIQPSRVSSALSLSPLRESLGSIEKSNAILPISARLSIEDLETVRKINLGTQSILPVARISQEFIVDKSKTEISHKNGRHAVFIEIFNKPGASLFDLDTNLRQTLARFPSLSFDVILNRTDDLRAAVSEVLESLYIAVFITFLVVFLFLRRGRQTLLICVTIPCSLVTTVLLIYVKGVSLNILTLSGLILGIGIVVDNAILVTGRIEELRAQWSTKMAAGLGAAQVAMPIVMSTLTNAIIFLPVSFLEGGDAFTDILKSFQLPILCSLVSSLFVSLVILPLLTMWWAPKESSAASSELKPPAAAVNFFRWCQMHRAPLAIMTLVLVTATGESIMNINQSDIEQPKDPYTSINVKFASEIGKEARSAIFRDIENRFLLAQAKVGFRFVVADYNPQFLSGSLLVYPEKSKDSDRMLNDQEAKLKTLISELPRVPGVKTTVGWTSASQTEKSQADSFAITGSKTIRIEAILEDMKAMALTFPGVESVRLDREENGAKSLVFLPYESVLSQYGLKFESLAGEISNGMTIVNVNNLKLDGQEVSAKISLVPGAGGWALSDLRKMKIRTGQNQSSTLNDLGQFVPMHFIRSISRRERQAEGRIHIKYKNNLQTNEVTNVQRWSDDREV